MLAIPYYYSSEYENFYFFTSISVQCVTEYEYSYTHINFLPNKSRVHLFQQNYTIFNSCVTFYEEKYITMNRVIHDTQKTFSIANKYKKLKPPT